MAPARRCPIFHPPGTRSSPWPEESLWRRVEASPVAVGPDDRHNEPGNQPNASETTAAPHDRAKIGQSDRLLCRRGAPKIFAPDAPPVSDEDRASSASQSWR